MGYRYRTLTRSREIKQDGIWWNVYFDPFDFRVIDAWLVKNHGGLLSLHWKHRSYRIASYGGFIAFRDEESAVLCHLAFA